MTVSVHQAKNHLSRLLRRVAAGEEIIVARYRQPVARIVPVAHSRKPRQFGWLKGKIWVGNNFDAPLPQGVLKSFYGRR